MFDCRPSGFSFPRATFGKCAAIDDWIAGASTLILYLFLGGQVSAQTLTTLASFNATNGQFPIAGLTAVGSTLYGTALKVAVRRRR